MSVKIKTQGLNPRQALLANKNCLEQGETPRRARLIREGRWIERKKGRTRQRKAQNSFVCRVKHDFAHTCPLAQCCLVNTAELSLSSLKGVLAFAYLWVCVYSEWVGQEGFWSETHRSSGFEGDHASTVSAALASTQYVWVCPPVVTYSRVVFQPLDIKGEFSRNMAPWHGIGRTLMHIMAEERKQH